MKIKTFFKKIFKKRKKLRKPLDLHITYFDCEFDSMLSYYKIEIFDSKTGFIVRECSFFPFNFKNNGDLVIAMTNFIFDSSLKFLLDKGLIDSYEL